MSKTKKSKITKSRINKLKITKADGIAYERYLYFKLMIIKDALEHLAEELLEIKAPDMLETYHIHGVTDGEFLMDMIEDIAKEGMMGGRGETGLHK